MEKKNTVFTDRKDRQVKYYYPNKKAVTHCIESGQKEFPRVQRNQQSFFCLSTWNLYVRDIIFVTDVVVLAIETFLIKRKARVQTGLSETVSAVSFLKILGYLYEAFEIREKGTSKKKVTLTDAKEDVDKICIEVRKTSDNAG